MERRNRRRAKMRTRGQAGATLIEILVVVGVITPVILSATLGMFTAVQSSEGTKSRQELELALTTFGDTLRSSVAYAPCGTATDYAAADRSTPGGWSDQLGAGAGAGANVQGSIAAVEYWDQASGSFGPKCTVDGGAQRITLEVRKGDRALTGDVVKRNPDARPEDGA